MRNVSVITGGAGGMGFSIANSLGSHGHAVLLCDINQSALDASVEALRRQNIDASYVVVDAAEQGQVAAAAKKAAKLGCIKNVIHTAGLSPVFVAGSSPEDGAATIMRVNAMGTVHFVEAFYPLFDEGASMVCFTSSACYLMPQVPDDLRKAFFSAQSNREGLEATLLSLASEPGRAYMFSKLFVMDYVRMNAGRFGKKGCRINSIAPGRIITPMHQTLIDMEPERVKKELAEMPLGRYGEAYEIGNLVEFLCSYQASYINGIDILMDDGTQAYTTTPQL